MLAKEKISIRSIGGYEEKSQKESWYVNVADGVGGDSFEYAKPEDVMAFIEPLGFKLRETYPEISPKGLGAFGPGSYQYLFERVH